jgi:hypothetical protein
MYGMGMETIAAIKKQLKELKAVHHTAELEGWSWQYDPESGVIQLRKGQDTVNMLAPHEDATDDNERPTFSTRANTRAIVHAMNALPKLIKTLEYVLVVVEGLEKSARVHRRLALQWHREGHTGKGLMTKTIANHSDTIRTELELAFADGWGIVDEDLEATIKEQRND